MEKAQDMEGMVCPWEWLVKILKLINKCQMVKIF